MNEDCLKLTTYFGERDRADGGFLADAFTDIYARHELQTSLVMRGVEGFGPTQHLRTDRLLSLSEDLPLVSVAVDTRPRIEAALTAVNELKFNGLVTLERARMLTGTVTAAVELPWAQNAETKLTVYVGRQERTNGTPAFEAVVSLLHRRGVAGATVLLGVDGTAHGVRQRARFFGRNASVPLMIIAVGDSVRIGGLLPELAAMLTRPLITLERVRVCKRDGEKLAEPSHLPQTDPSGLRMWQKLMVYTGEQAHHDGQPLHHKLLRRAPPRHSRRGDESAWHLGLPREPSAPRRLVLAAAPPRADPHRDRRHPRTHPPMVRHRRRAHQPNRPRDQRNGPRLPCHRTPSAVRRATTRGTPAVASCRVALRRIPRAASPLPGEELLLESGQELAGGGGVKQRVAIAQRDEHPPAEGDDPERRAEGHATRG